MSKLKLKREYLNWSIGGGKLKKRKFCDIHESEFPMYWNAGFTEFFEVIEEKPIKKEKTPEIEKLEDNDTDK